MIKNTKAKYLLEDINVDEISMTVGSGSATQKNGEMAYLTKSGDITLTEEQDNLIKNILGSSTDVVVELSFQDFLERFLHMYGEDSQMLCKLMGYSYEDKSYPETREAAIKMVDEKLSKIHLIKAEDMSQEQITLMKSVKEVFEKADSNLPNSAFAYVPDPDKTSTRKLRIDDANHTRAAVAALGEGFRGNKVVIPEKDLPAVKRKVAAAYRKFFPDNEVPSILKALGKSSDPVSEHNKNSDPLSEDTTKTTSTEVDKTKEKEDLTLDIQELLKSQELQDFLKSHEEDIKKSVASEYEEKLSELQKANELANKEIEKSKVERLSRIKKGFTKGVSTMEFIAEDQRENIVKGLVDNHENTFVIEMFDQLVKAQEQIVKLKDEFALDEAGLDKALDSSDTKDETLSALEKSLEAKFSDQEYL